MPQSLTKVILTLACASLDDAGFYQIVTNGGESFAELIVEEKPVEFKDSIIILYATLTKVGH